MMKTKIYMLPGLMCNEKLWSKISPLLSEFELVTLSIPKKSTLDEMVESLLEQLPKEPVNLLGFSLGGYIASYITTKASHRIKKLLVIAATGCDLPEDEIKKRFSLLNMESNFVLKSLSKAKVLTLLDKQHHEDEALIQLIQEMYKELGETVFKQQMQSTLHREDLLQKMQELTVPTSFLYAKGDRLVNKSWLLQLTEVPTIQQTMLNNSSHMLPLEEPQQVATHMKGFFT